MLRGLLLLLVLSPGAPPAATAQTRIGIRAGATLSSALVRDSITEPLSVRPAPGPSLAFAFDVAISARYRLELALGSSWSRLVERSEGDTRDVVSFAVWHPALTIERLVSRLFSARGTIGALLYRPRHTDGNLFQGGAPISPVVGVGLGFERPVGRGLFFTVDLSYDVHRFTTTSLREAGFIGERPVHRVTAAAGVRRVW